MTNRARSLTACLFLLAFTSMVLQPACGSGTKDPGSSRTVTETLDGLRWHEPLKVTDNDLDDYYGTLDIGPDDMSHVVYLQSGTNEMWAKVDGQADKVLFSDKLLYNGYVPTQYQVKEKSTEQPTEHFVVDSKGRLHAIWAEAGLLDNKYRCFDGEGRPVTETLDLAQIAELSRLPYLVVGKDDKAYIAFENEGTAWVQMTYVTDRASLKAPVLIGRPGENVAYIVDPEGNMHMFYRSLGADVSIHYTKLNPNRGFMVKPVVLYPHTSEIANPYSSMPTLAATPNGHIHILLSDTTIAPHPIYYTELDEVGNIVHNFTKVVDGAYNYGDIEGDGANGVYMTWDDYTDGEVHYARIYDGRIGEDHVISDTGGHARYPQLRLGTHDALHVTWVDRSGGDGEVYYRYAENFRVTADVPAAKQLERMRPNETVTTELAITNSGDLENELTVKASLNTNNVTGWSVTIGQEATPLDKFGAKTLTLQPDGTISFPLKVSSPGFDVGRNGESIGITFDILVKRASAKDVTLRLSPVLSVERDVSVSEPGSITARGSEVHLAFDVSNSGDVPEIITGSIIGAPQGWRFNSSVPVTLKPGRTVNMTFVNDGPVQAQNDSVQLVAAMFEITEVGNASGTMPTMQLFRNVRVHYEPRVFLAGSSGPITWPTGPGGGAAAALVLENKGRESADASTSITVSDGGPGWGVEVVQGGTRVTHVPVPAGGLVQLVVQAVPPPDASHELPFVFEITFTEMGTSSSVTFPFTATVPAVRGVTVTPSSEGVMHGVPEKETSIPITIRNVGNVHETLVPEVSGTTAAVPFNWRFGETDPVLELELGPYEETVVPLVITMSKNATNVSDLPLQVGVIDDDGVSHTTEVFLSVERVDGVELVANITARTVVSGDDVRFDMTVVNDGNAEDTFYLGVQELPWGWEAVYTDEEGGRIQSMMLPTAGKMDITLTLHPLMVTQETLDVTAVAWATSGLASFVDLHLEMLLPDMAIEDISSDNDNVVGHSTTVLVWVTNKGRAPATVDVTMFTTDPEQDGGPKTVTLAPGESTKVGFSYKPNREVNNIEVILDRHNGVYETNEDNNIGNYISNAQPKGAGQVPGFDPTLGFLACMMVGIGLSIRSRRCRGL